VGFRPPQELAGADLASRYRSDLARIDTVIQAIAGLQIVNEHFSDRRLSFERFSS